MKIKNLKVLMKNNALHQKLDLECPDHGGTDNPQEILEDDKLIASLEISADRSFWLAKVAGHERNEFG